MLNFEWAEQRPKITPSIGGSGPHVINAWFAVSAPQTYLERFSRFRGLMNVTNRQKVTQTNTQTDHATPSVAVGHI